MAVPSWMVLLGLTLPLAAALEQPVGDDPGAGPLGRHELIDLVLARNLDVETARRTLRAAGERSEKARALPDPELGYEIAPLSAGAGMRFGQIVSLSQRFPVPGNLRLEQEVARSEAQTARHDLETVQLDIAVLTSTLYDEYYYLRRASELNTRHVELLQDFKRVATARYASGTAMQQDAILAEVELAHLEHLDLILEAEQSAVVARINELLHSGPAEPLPPPPVELPVPEFPVETSEELQHLALSGRPELRAQESALRARGLEVELRRKDGRPEFEAMTSWNSMWDDAEHRWMVGASVNLPVRGERTRAGIAESEARLHAARGAWERLEVAVRSEVHRAWLRVLESHHTLDLFQSRLLPATEDALRAALASFESGVSSSLAVIEAQKTRRSTELGYERALADLYQRLAELDGAVGRMPGGWSAEGVE